MAAGNNLLICSLVWLSLSGFPAAAPGAEPGELPRRPYLGLALQALPPPDQGLLVTRVFPLSSASEAGMTEGDVVLKLNGKPVATPDELIQMVKTGKTGESFALDTLSKSIPVKRTVQLKAFPLEKAADFEVAYGSLSVDGALRRTIMTRPKKTGKVPAVLLVGGIGCYPADSPLDDTNAYKRLLYGLTARNLVTLRIEKSGMGDSQGQPCAGGDFAAELRSYRRALDYLQSLDFVDRDRIFVFGHSMGGIIAPILAAQFPLCGIVAACTVGDSWFSYELENTRRQAQLRGMPPDQVDRRLRLKELCLHCLTAEKKTPEQILKDHPDCKDDLTYPASYKYMQQVADLNLPRVWASVSCPVLVIFGTSDFVTSEPEHRVIVERLNSLHRGQATLVKIQGMDHFLSSAATMQDSFKAKNSGASSRFDSRLVPAVGNWIKRVSRSTSGKSNKLNDDSVSSKKEQAEGRQ
jgi:uncharacterized protein